MPEIESIDHEGNKIVLVNGQRYGWLTGWQHAYPITSGPHREGEEPDFGPLLNVGELWYGYSLYSAIPMTE